jgi:hypothetical protein
MSDDEDELSSSSYEDTFNEFTQACDYIPPRAPSLFAVREVDTTTVQTSTGSQDSQNAES